MKHTYSFNELLVHEFSGKFDHGHAYLFPTRAGHSAYGAQHSSVAKEVTNRRHFKLPINPDPFPEQVVFIRSDLFSFIKQGIHSLFIKSGFLTVAPDTVNRKVSVVA